MPVSAQLSHHDEGCWRTGLIIRAFASLRFAPGSPLTVSFPGKIGRLPGGLGKMRNTLPSVVGQNCAAPPLQGRKRPLRHIMAGAVPPCPAGGCLMESRPGMCGISGVGPGSDRPHGRCSVWSVTLMGCLRVQ